MSRVCLRFELPIENTDSKSPIFRSYRRYRWTSYFGGSVHQCSVGGHETKICITDGVLIYPSVRAEKNSSLTVNCLYHPYRRYRWTRSLRPTSRPWNNANYLFHQRILHIHRWCIHFSIGTDEQPRFTDGKLPLPSVPSVPMDKVSDGYLISLD